MIPPSSKDDRYLKGWTDGKREANELKDKKIKQVLKNRRQKINEGIQDERLLAHLHTFVNQFENEIFWSST